MLRHAFFACLEARAAQYHRPMKWSWGQLGPAVAVAFSLAGCSDGDSGVGPGPGSETLGELSVVEVTTVTTVQASNGIFLSPRPQQDRPDYVERGRAASAVSPEPSADEGRAKVDSALLFRALEPQAFELEASLDDLEAQHYFPAISGRHWPISLLGSSASSHGETWTEWDGWRAYGGLVIDDAPAATLDYERLGLPSPLVLGAQDDSGTERLLVTNRSDKTIPKALLVYSHDGGVGVRLVQELGPGMSAVTTTGPKEHLPEVLLEEARDTLVAFFSEELGKELAVSIARSKSIPFLETHGLRLIYLLDDALAPAAIGLPAGIGAQRRIAIAQAEVLQPMEEANVLLRLARGELTAEGAPAQLGRFARAKLEGASLNGDAGAQQQAQELLQSLSE